MLYISDSDGLGKFKVTNDLTGESTDCTLGELEDFTQRNYVAGYVGFDSVVLTQDTKDKYYFGDVYSPDSIDAIGVVSLGSSFNTFGLQLQSCIGTSFSSFSMLSEAFSRNKSCFMVSDYHQTSLTGYYADSVSSTAEPTNNTNTNGIINNIVLVGQSSIGVPCPNTSHQGTASLNISDYYEFKYAFIHGQRVTKNGLSTKLYILHRFYVADVDDYFLMVFFDDGYHFDYRLRGKYNFYTQLRGNYIHWREPIYCGKGLIISLQELRRVCTEQGYSIANGVCNSKELYYKGLDGSVYVDLKRFDAGHGLSISNDEYKRVAKRKILGMDATISVRTDGAVICSNVIDNAFILPDTAKYIDDDEFSVLGVNYRNPIKRVVVPKSFEGCYKLNKTRVARSNSLFHMADVVDVDCECDFDAMINLFNYIRLLPILHGDLLRAIHYNYFSFLERVRGTMRDDVILYFYTLGGFKLNNPFYKSICYVRSVSNKLPLVITTLSSSFKSGISKYHFFAIKDSYIGRTYNFNTDSFFSRSDLVTNLQSYADILRNINFCNRVPIRQVIDLFSASNFSILNNWITEDRLFRIRDLSSTSSLSVSTYRTVNGCVPILYLYSNRFYSEYSPYASKFDKEYYYDAVNFFGNINSIPLFLCIALTLIGLYSECRIDTSELETIFNTKLSLWISFLGKIGIK